MIGSMCDGEACRCRSVKTLRGAAVGGAGRWNAVDNETAVQNLRRLAEAGAAASRSRHLGRRTTHHRGGGAGCRRRGDCLALPRRRRKRPSSSSRPTTWARERGTRRSSAQGSSCAHAAGDAARAICFNAGAAVTCEGSASLEDLQALQSRGVEIPPAAPASTTTA